MKWAGTLSVIFTLLFMVVLAAGIAGYVAIKGPTFISFDATIYNVDPAGRTVYFQTPGAPPKPLAPQQSAQIKVSPGTVISAGFSSRQLNLVYRVPSIKTNTFYVFQDSIQDNTTAFNLTIINAAPEDYDMWALDTTTNEPVVLTPPDVGAGGQVQIPVYTNEVLKFAPSGTSFSDAPYVFVVQMSWVNEVYISTSGLTTSTAKQ